LTFGVLVAGDGGGQVFALRLADGTTVGSPLTLLYGRLTGGCAVRGVTAYFGEGATQGTTAMHALDATTGTDTWASSGPQLSGSVDASPVLRGATLYVGLSTGFLQPIDIASPSSPRVRNQLNVMQLTSGATAAITGMLLAPDGRSLILITAAGLYGVALGPPPSVLWSAQTGSSFIGAPAVLAGWMLCAATGTTVVGYDVSSTPNASHQLSPAWTFTSSAAITSLQRIGRDFVLAGDAGGNLTLLWNTSGAGMGQATFRSTVSGTTNAIGALNNGLLTFATSSGIVANHVMTTWENHIATSASWQAPGLASHSAPLVTDGAAYVLGDDNKLHALDAGDGSELWSQPMPGASSPYGRTTIVPYAWAAKQASVAFLKDSEYFYKLRDLLAATAAGSVTTATLPPESQRQFASMIGAVGAAGHPAFVLMWDETPLMTMMGATSGRLINPLTWVLYNKPTYFVRQWLSRWLQVGVNENSRSSYALKKLPGVQTFAEPYDRVWPDWYDSPVELASNHQKIAIFSINGTKFALVGGFNLITPQYFDDPSHPLTSTDAGKLNFYSWHDTAVLLQGDAATLVEAEFDRRWAKSGGTSASGLPSTYAKVAAWHVRHTSCLDDDAVCSAGQPTPQPYSNPTLTSPQVPTEILVTNDEKGLTPSARIRDRLVELIYGAQNYVYLENFTFHSIDLVRALVDRLSAAQCPRIILLLTYPTVGAGEPVQRAQNLLTRMALLALEIAAGGWQAVVLSNGESVLSTASPSLMLNERGVEFSQLVWLRPDGTAGQTLLGHIERIERSQSSANLFVGAPARYIASPAAGDEKYQLPGLAANYRSIYVHSKLALIDDQVAVVGSANLSRRSMRQDGEMSACIDDPTTATAVRTALFTHWGMTTPAKWGADMAAFAATTTAGIGVLPLSSDVLNPGWPPLIVETIMGAIDPSVAL
jgi:phosphatidylserine/phosphatidylglycerophosphate/cardiolipin synthase-like enzyme/outer membrane protein assembly factor BamB